MFRKEHFIKPWVLVLVSVSSSVIIYSFLIVLLDLKEPMVGMAIAIGAPFVVSLPIALIISSYIKRIQEKNEKLAKLDDINKRLFSLLSHDLRSPLASQKQALDLLLKEDLDSQSGKEILAEVSDRTDKLIHFLNNVLEWAHKQRSGEKVERSLFLAQDIILPLLDLYQAPLKSKNLKLRLGDIAYEVYADPESYSFVFRNLLHNAIKFTPKGGEIEIHAERSNNEVHTIIKDNGVGMSPSQLESIKSAKWISTQGTENEMGTGFGINSCLNYLELNQGELRINSESGKGSRFEIILPATSPQK